MCELWHWTVRGPALDILLSLPQCGSTMAPQNALRNKNCRKTEQSIGSKNHFLFVPMKKDVHHDDNENFAVTQPQMLAQLMRLHHWNKHIHIGEWLANGFHCQLVRVCVCLTNICQLFWLQPTQLEVVPAFQVALFPCEGSHNHSLHHCQLSHSCKTSVSATFC